MKGGWSGKRRIINLESTVTEQKKPIKKKNTRGFSEARATTAGFEAHSQTVWVGGTIRNSTRAWPHGNPPFSISKRLPCLVSASSLEDFLIHPHHKPRGLVPAKQVLRIIKQKFEKVIFPRCWTPRQAMCWIHGDLSACSWFPISRALVRAEHFRPGSQRSGFSLQVEAARSRPDSQEHNFQIVYSYPTCSSFPPGCTGDQGKGKFSQKALSLRMPTIHTLEDKGSPSPVSVSIWHVGICNAALQGTCSWDLVFLSLWIPMEC